MAQIFLADLHSIKTVSVAKVRWRRWYGRFFYVGNLALSLQKLCLQWSEDIDMHLQRFHIQADELDQQFRLIMLSPPCANGLNQAAFAVGHRAPA
jgi:hypothetical protein